MKIKLLFIFNIVLFLLGLISVKLQTEIIKTSYKISQKRKEISELGDFKNVLSYNLMVKCSIEPDELSFEEFKFAKKRDVFTITSKEVKRRTRLWQGFFNITASAQER